MELLWKNIINLNAILSVSLPADFLQICHESDPQLSQCVTNSIHALKPLLKTGIPEYDIIGLEPLELGDLLVAGSKTGQGLSISAKDIKVYGAGNFFVKNFK